MALCHPHYYFLGSEYEGLVDAMKKQNDHLSSLTFTVGEKGESTLFERKGKKDPSIRSKTETHFDTHVGFFKYCHKTFLITAWAMQVLPYAQTIAQKTHPNRPHQYRNS